MISLSKQYLYVACILAAASSFSFGWLTSPPSTTRSTSLARATAFSMQQKRMFVGSTTRLNEGKDSLVDKSPRDVANAVADTAEDAKDAVADTAEDAKSLLEKAKDKAVDAKDYVKDKAVDAKDYVKDKAVDAKDNAKDKAGTVKDKAVAVKDALVGTDEE